VAGSGRIEKDMATVYEYLQTKAQHYKAQHYNNGVGSLSS